MPNQYDNKRQEPQRMTFAYFIDRLFWALLTACSFYISSKIASLSNSVGRLDVKMSTVIERGNSTDRRIESIEHRLDRIEERRR